jgi:hypothetical protein
MCFKRTKVYFRAVSLIHVFLECHSIQRTGRDSLRQGQPVNCGVLVLSKSLYLPQTARGSIKLRASKLLVPLHETMTTAVPLEPSSPKQSHTMTLEWLLPKHSPMDVQAGPAVKFAHGSRTGQGQGQQSFELVIRCTSICLAHMRGHTCPTAAVHACMCLLSCLPTSSCWLGKVPMQCICRLRSSAWALARFRLASHGGGGKHAAAPL